MSSWDFAKFYQQLIQTPSISSQDPAWDQSNLAVIQLLADALTPLGFQCKIEALPGLKNKYNLLATRLPAHWPSAEPIRGGLLLAGHTDTVPFDAGRWQKDPFQLTEEGGKLYGLGSIDMKGFFAFVLDALQRLDWSQLTAPLAIFASADEEITMAGARALAASQRLAPAYAVIGEPTDLVPVTAHKGHMAEAIQITGQSGHSSDPANGVNALELMHSAMGQLLTLQQNLAQRYQDPRFAVPQPTLNFGAIQGGDSPNRICGCCTLSIDLRPTPQIGPAELMGLIETALAPLEVHQPGCLHIRHLHEPIPAFATDARSPLVQEIERISGHAATTVNYCTEAPFISALGCQTVVWGPGSINQAHQPDEYLAVAMVKPAQQQLQQLIGRFCFAG
ncbi:MAG: acetylornithine deacetylase [Aeromonas sp.]